MDNLLKTARVVNMTSPRNGGKVPNQFVITTDDGEYFQSYDSIIAFRPKGRTGDEATDAKIVLDSKYWDYSKTTGKYRNQFLDEKKADTMRASQLRLIQFYQMEFQLFASHGTKAPYLETALDTLTKV